MARIRILRGIAGSDFSWSRGDIVDLDDVAAAAWADGQRAEYVDPPAPPGPADDQPGRDGDNPPPPAGTTPAEQPPAAFDPGEHTVADIVAYLGAADAAEVQRVLDAEAAGQARKGIANQGEQLLADARERDAAAQAAATVPPAEVTADASRGGGRGEQPETR